MDIGGAWVAGISSIMGAIFGAGFSYNRLIALERVNDALQSQIASIDKSLAGMREVTHMEVVRELEQVKVRQQDFTRRLDLLERRV